MTWAVVCHPEATHEDFAIVRINLLPTHAMQFGAVQDVINEFLEDQHRILVREIQPSHLGQALVRFANVHDRDNMVNSSPHAFGGVQISFVRFQDGNWRALNFNRECWLMLLGFPLDY
jgi:hypothetical protein